MSAELWAIGSQTFLLLLPAMDPFGNMSIFATLTESMPQRAIRRLAIQATLVALFGVLFFGFFGGPIFSAFGLNIDELRIVGGVIFFLMGYDMLQARLARTKVSPNFTETDRIRITDMAVTPLGIPLICGPGTMTVAMLQMSRVHSVWGGGGFVVGAVLMWLLTLICFLSSTRLTRWLGQSGRRVVLRLMGLLLMVMAVHSFFEGLGPIVRRMLDIGGKTVAGS